MLRTLLRSLALAFLAHVVPSNAATVALVGGRLIDGFGGPPLANSVILIEGERITAIGQVGKLPRSRQMPRSSPPKAWMCCPVSGIATSTPCCSGTATTIIGTKLIPTRFGSEIMPAAAQQLLMAGVTSARDLGAPLKESIEVRDRINRGEIPGPTLYVSGPFIQHEPYPGTEAFRWGVKGAADARAKVKKLAEAGVNIIKLIDQDQMTMEEVKAVVDEAHAHKLPVVAHSHRPEEIRRGLAAGVDCFEHTGLATAPGFPEDVLKVIAERTAKMSLGPLFWCPTIEGFLNYEHLLENPEATGRSGLAARCADRHRRGHPKSIHRIPGSSAITRSRRSRATTVANKFRQLQESGVVLLIGTDSGIPMKFHSNSTWHELDGLGQQAGRRSDDGDPRRDLLAGGA